MGTSLLCIKTRRLLINIPNDLEEVSYLVEHDLTTLEFSGPLIRGLYYSSLTMSATNSKGQGEVLLYLLHFQSPYNILMIGILWLPGLLSLGDVV